MLVKNLPLDGTKLGSSPLSLEGLLCRSAPNEAIWPFGTAGGFQTKGLFYTNPGHSPCVRGPVFPSQAKGLLHRFEAVALGAEGG
jgi:hypothetical protein